MNTDRPSGQRHRAGAVGPGDSWRSLALRRCCLMEHSVLHHWAEGWHPGGGGGRALRAAGRLDRWRRNSVTLKDIPLTVLEPESGYSGSDGHQVT